MRPLTITRTEFNNMLNFGALTAAEFGLAVDGRDVEPRDFTTDFISSQDVVVDYVSAAKVAALCRTARSFVIRISRYYPWHDALIEDCVAHSVRRGFAVTPTLIFCKDTAFSFGQDDEVRWFEGEKPDLQASEGPVELAGSHLFAWYRRDTRVQRELVGRCMRRQLATVDDGEHRLSDLGSDRFIELVEEILTDSAASEIGSEEFRQTLLQIWPAGARGRLASYVYLKEGRRDLFARTIPWNVSLGDGTPVALGGRKLTGEGEVAKTLRREGIRRMHAFGRSPETDEFVLAGALRYEEGTRWDFLGWPVMTSPLDPTVVVRTDGLYRWLTIAGHGVQSIERAAGGENRAVGGSFIQQHYHPECRGEHALFLGLGLGVVQRAWSDVEVTTIENSAAVCEIFARLYPQEPRHRIIQDDFKRFIDTEDRRWKMMILDFHDPDDLALSDEWLSVMLARLAEEGTIVINRHAPSAFFVDACRNAAERFDLEIEHHPLDHDQRVVALRLR